MLRRRNHARELNKKLRKSQHNRRKKVYRQLHDFKEFCETYWDLFPKNTVRVVFGVPDHWKGEGTYGIVPRESFFQMAEAIRNDCRAPRSRVTERHRRTQWFAQLKDAWLTALERQLAEDAKSAGRRYELPKTDGD